jgi:hypothetical protein
MNILPFDKQTAIVAALVEGVSIRATERLTGTHRDTIMRLGARVGEGCAMLHDQMMRNLNVARVELDEAWSYVGKKQKKIAPGDDPDLGDQYVFIASERQGDYQLSRRQAHRSDHPVLCRRSPRARARCSGNLRRCLQGLSCGD